MKLRNKIYDLLLFADPKLPVAETVDAIIAALPECMPDLVWRDDFGERVAKTTFGHYVISCQGKRLELILGYGRASMVVLWRDDNPSREMVDAKAAASAHNSAAVMAAFGL